MKGNGFRPPKPSSEFDFNAFTSPRVSPTHRSRYSDASNHKSVLRPPDPPSAPFKAIPSATGPAQPTNPFNGARSSDPPIQRTKPSVAPYNTHQAFARPRPSLSRPEVRPQRSFPSQPRYQSEFSPSDNGYSHRPSNQPRRSHPNGSAYRDFRHEDQSTEPPSKIPRKLSSNPSISRPPPIDNPNDFRFRKTASPNDACPNGGSDHRRKTPRNTEGARRGFSPEHLGSQQKRIPAVPSEHESLNWLPGENDSVRERERSDECKPLENLDGACTDRAERPRDQPRSTRREQQKRALADTARPKSVARSDRRTRCNPQLRSVPTPDPKHSRSSSLASERLHDNCPAQQSERTRNQPEDRARGPAIMIPQLKSSRRQRRPDTTENKAEKGSKVHAVKSQQARDSEPVDVDEESNSGTEKRTSRESIPLAKVSKEGHYRTHALDAVKKCFCNGAPDIEITFMGLVDIDMSQVAAIPVPPHCNKPWRLDVSYNQLTKLSQAVNEWLFELSPVHLSLQSNRLSLIHGFRPLHRLRFLDLSRNKLSTLPDEITELPSLQTLDLRKNVITILPPGFKNLRKLKSLDVSENQLNKLPSDFAEENSELQCLDVSGNPSFREFPDCVEYLTKLEELRFYGTTIHGSQLVQGKAKWSPVDLLKKIAGCTANKDMSGDSDDPKTEEVS